MTVWQNVGVALGLLAYAVAWLWGGRPERCGAVFLLVVCMISTLTSGSQIGGFNLASLLVDIARLAAFGWLCLRFDRWWPLVVTAGITLMIIVQGAKLIDPSISQYAVGSADVGLGYVIDLALLLSVFERWLAGEKAAGPAAWAKAARRRRRGAGAGPSAPPSPPRPSAP